MAGQPRRTALEQEFAHRINLTFGQQNDQDDALPTALDYVCQWLEGGRTLKALAAEIEPRVKFECAPAFIQRWLRNRFGEENTDRAISDARIRASHQYAEDALAIVDEPAETNVEVNRAASRARSRQWLAEKYNPQAFGAKQVSGVVVNIGTLHLSALQSRTFATATPVLDVVDAALASIDDAELPRLRAPITLGNES